MDNLDFNFTHLVDQPQRASRSSGKKRKWREIEAIKEKQRLRKELMDIDPIFDDLSEAEF